MTPADRPARPNILLISTDQQRADHLGCYGARVLRTPHIDGLAARGTRFTRAYVAAPVCMPNRASLMTGRMPSLTGVRHNGLDLPLETTTIADALRAAGYRTSLSGKAHFQCVTTAPAQIAPDPEERAAARRPGPGRYGQELGALWRDGRNSTLDLPYYGFEEVDLIAGHGDQVDGHYNRWVAEQGADLEALRGPANALASDCTLFQAWRTAVPEHLYPTAYVRQRTVAALERHATDPGRPFFHWASFADPHHPFTPPGRYWDLYDPDRIDLPDGFAEACRGHWPNLLAEARRAGCSNLNGTAAIAVSEEELRWAIALTYGAIAMIDDAVGSILRALRQSGLAENTIVIFLSDHGDFMGDHGLIFKGPIHLQSVIRIPLIWCDPRPSARTGVIDDLVSTVDIPATILSAAGVPAIQGMNGRPILGAPEVSEPARRDAVLIEDEVQSDLPGTTIRGRARSLITKDWRLTIHDGIAGGELYNLAEDPDEAKNLWDEPAMAACRASLTERLVREMIACSETSPRPDYAA